MHACLVQFKDPLVLNVILCSWSKLSFLLAIEQVEDIPSLEETRRPDHLNRSTGKSLRTLSPQAIIRVFALSSGVGSIHDMNAITREDFLSLQMMQYRMNSINWSSKLAHAGNEVSNNT